MPQTNKFGKIASFDLYDTLIMRSSLTATSVYEQLWSSLNDKGLAVPDCATFVQARERADVDSKAVDAPSLAKILEYLGDDLRPLAQQIETAEIELELAQLRTIPAGEAHLQQCRQDGFRIAFISDMHIGSVHLKHKLSELGLMQEDDLLMVSSDHGVSKSKRGRLFLHFLLVNEIQADSVTHFGNNEWSDVTMARKHGLSAHLCPPANPNRFETMMIDASSNGRALETMASVSRDTRLYCQAAMSLVEGELSTEQEALKDIACSVASPVMVAFVLWAIRRCREESISTVRFLTRDGELPYLIAKALPTDITEGLDMGMLEVSRRSLVLPAASVVPIERWLKFGLEPGSFLAQQIELLPASEVVGRVGLSFDQDAELLSHFGLIDPHTPMSKDAANRWKNALQTDMVRQEVRRYSLARLKSTNAYLRQNLPGMSEQRVGLIDIGWTGQQAAMLSALIREEGGCDPLHLHVGRLRNKPLIIEADVEGWLFDERVKRSPVQNPVALFESFCVTTTGGVDGYKINGNGVATAIRRAQPHKNNIEAWGQSVVRHCVLAYAENAGAVMNQISAAALRDISEQLLVAFWESPTRVEAEKWGAFPYEQDQTGQTIRQLSNPYNWTQLKSRLGNSYNGVDWKAGSIELSPTPVREIMRLRERYRRR